MESVKLLIELLPNGSINIGGPVVDGKLNKAFCYMLLELAKDEIREICAKQASDIVVVPPNGLPK